MDGPAPRLVMVPTAEALWRDAASGPGRRTSRRAVEGTVVTEMYSALEARGVRHEPETDALVLNWRRQGTCRGA